MRITKSPTEPGVYGRFAPLHLYSNPCSARSTSVSMTALSSSFVTDRVRDEWAVHRPTDRPGTVARPRRVDLVHPDEEDEAAGVVLDAHSDESLPEAFERRTRYGVRIGSFLLLVEPAAHVVTHAFSHASVRVHEDGRPEASRHELARRLPEPDHRPPRFQVAIRLTLGLCAARVSFGFDVEAPDVAVPALGG